MRDGRIEYLIRLVEKSDIAELEICEGWGKKIRISKAATVTTPAAAAGSNPVETPPPAATAAPVETEAADDGLTPVVAPMVGTFYRAATPDASPFVEVGSNVNPGQTLCIIEAMKIMNEIPSEVKGSIRKILVENGQPIEFGQTLFLIEPSS